MSVGKGGSSQKQSQSGSQRGAFTGATDSTTNQTGTSTTSGTQTGAQTGTQTGTQTGAQTGTTAGQTSGQTTANPTGGFSSVSDLLQGLISGSSGLTPQQLMAMGINTNVAQDTANTMDYGGKVLSQYVGDNHPAYQIAAQDKVVAPSGSAFINDYTNPFESQVVDATRNDLTQGFKTGLNELRASYGGQYGNGREGVAAGTAADNFDRTLGTTLGGLRSANYGTAVQAGQGDAARQLQANTANADAGTRVNMFNTGQQNINDQQSIGVVNDWIAQQQAKGNMLASAGNANANISQGGLGNLFEFLNSQVPAFGQSSTGAQTGINTGTSTGSSTGTSSGTSTGTTDSTTATTLENIIKSLTSGTSSGTSTGTGSSSGKNGGLSLG